MSTVGLPLWMSVAGVGLSAEEAVVWLSELITRRVGYFFGLTAETLRCDFLDGCCRGCSWASWDDLSPRVVKEICNWASWLPQSLG